MNSWHSIKIDPADTMFSRYLRLKERKCMRCGRPGEGEEGINGLQASHFHSRKKKQSALLSAGISFNLIKFLQRCHYVV